MEIVLTDVEFYVARLLPEFQQLYKTADLFVMIAEDTSTEEFQIAATVQQIFWDRAKQAKENNQWPNAVTDHGSTS